MTTRQYASDDGGGRINANFRDLRDAWEVKSSSSTSTQKAGNCDADNRRRRQLRQDEIYSLKQNLGWDREQTPILAWQRLFEEEGGHGGRYCSSIDEGSDDEDEAYMQSHRDGGATSSQSSATEPWGTNPKDIEEEAKRKLLAFLSKPEKMNWEDLVRSLASEKMEKKSRKSGRSRSTRSSSIEPPAAPMLNKIITVFAPAGSFDDGISEMDCNENADRLSKKERKKRDRLETMIEGVVMGQISVDVGDSFLRKVGDRIVHVEESSLDTGDVDEDLNRCATTESSSIHIMSKGNRDIIVEAPSLTTPLASNIAMKSVSTKLQNHGSHASEFSSGDATENRSYNHIPSPPKRKSLSKLSSTFAPFRTGFGNSGAKCNASNLSSLGTPHTTPMSISSRSTDNSGSDSESNTPIVVIRPAATETVHHHHHYHHHVTPDVQDTKKKKNDSLPRSWRSHPSPPAPPQQPPLIPSKAYSQGHNRPSMLIPPPLMSTDACPSPTRSTNTSSSSSCSGGGWSSATTDSVSPPSSDVPLHRVGIAPRIMSSSGAQAIRRARANSTCVDSLDKGGSRKIVLSRKSKGTIPAEVSNRNVAVVFPPATRASESDVDYAELVYGAIGKGCVASTGDDFAVIEKENCTRVVNSMNGSSTTISIEHSARKDVDTSQNVMCTSSTTTTTRTVTTNSMVACRTFNTSSSSVEVLPILIRPETLAFNEVRASCWQVTRHRMLKTRGEF